MMYKSFMEFLPNIESLLEEHKIELRNIDNNLYLLVTGQFCIKIYDRCGHGYSFGFSILEKANSEYYSSDEFVENWFFRYLKQEYESSSLDRSIVGYNHELEKFKNKIQYIIEYLEKTESDFWESLKAFVRSEIKKDPIYANYKFDK